MSLRRGKSGEAACSDILRLRCMIRSLRADFLIFRGVFLDFGGNFLSSITDLLVLLAVIVRMLLVASRRREREVLLSSAPDNQSCLMRRSSGATRCWYCSTPSSVQNIFVRLFSSFGAEMFIEVGSLVSVVGRLHSETIRSWCESMVGS